MKVGETPGNGEESPTFREEPYIVIDPTGWAVYGSFNEFVTHAWQLADVENFLKEVYESNGLKW